MAGEAASGSVIAVIDDDTDLRQSVAALLADSGFTPVPLADSAGFYALGDDPGIDLALIDLKLGDESGLDLAIAVRERYGLPIVMLTGVGDETDRIVGLETGADDYMMKPFNPRELIARIHAVLRRTGRASAEASSNGYGQIRAFGALRLDVMHRELLGPDNSQIALTNAEYRLLEYFLRHPDRIIPRTELLTELGSDLSQYMDRTIDVLILRLRRKIEPVPSKPVHLQTRRGQGYIFVPEAQ